MVQGIILTDSKSTCTALNHEFIDQSQFYENCIINLIKDLPNIYHFQRIPGHADIFGNERADLLAKHAVEKVETETISQVIPLQDAYTLIKNLLYDKWSKTYAKSTEGVFNVSINNKCPPKTL